MADKEGMEGVRPDFTGGKFHSGVWKRLLIEEGWASRMSGRDKDVLDALAIVHANAADARTFVSAETLGEELELHPDTVRYSLRRLHKYGLIQPVRAADRNGRTRRMWEVNPPPPVPAQVEVVGRRGKPCNLNKRNLPALTADSGAPAQSVGSGAMGRPESTERADVTFPRNGPKNVLSSAAGAAGLFLPQPCPALRDQIPEPEVVRACVELNYAQSQREYDPDFGPDVYVAPAPGLDVYVAPAPGLEVCRRHRDACSAYRLMGVGAHDLAWRVLCRPAVELLEDDSPEGQGDKGTITTLDARLEIEKASQRLNAIERELGDKYGHHPELVEALKDVIHNERVDVWEAEDYLGLTYLDASSDDPSTWVNRPDPRPVSALNCIAYGPGTLWL